jgi:transposase
LDTSPIAARSLEPYYRIDGNQLGRHYKEHLSGYYDWEERPHADRYLVFPENFGPRMSIDETSTKDGELFTILSNKEGHGRKGSIAAIVRGTRVEDVSSAINLVPEPIRKQVGEVTLDFSSSMEAIVQSSFPWAYKTLDRFHMQRMATEAVQALRRRLLREAMAEEAKARKNFRAAQKVKRTRVKNSPYYKEGRIKSLPATKAYKPKCLPNGDTVPELLTRCSYLLMKSADKWSDGQKERAKILFDLYPDIQKAYSLSHSLRVIFNNKNATPESARVSLKGWYDKVKTFKNEDFHTLAETIQSREEDVLNFFLFRSTNASAEALNTKIKAFRAQLRGVVDLKFFLFRLTRIYA